MAEIRISRDRAERLAALVSEMNYTPRSFHRPEMFPDAEDEYIASNFFFFLTAIDHRTHISRKQRYRAYINNILYRGSDLMYVLAKSMQDKVPDFFTAAKLKNIDAGKVQEVFDLPDGIQIRDPGQRAMLLRDAATILIKNYDADIRSLLRRASGYLRREDNSGILQQLTSIKAYQDPLEKKSLLLVKLLRRRALLEVKDKEHLSVPVDNILMLVALRSGLIEVVEDMLRHQLLEGMLLDAQDVFLLRRATRDAFETVSNISALDPDVLDDLLWIYGREFNSEVPTVNNVDKSSPLLDARIDDSDALKQFVRFINGLDEDAPANSYRYLDPNVPETWYF